MTDGRVHAPCPFISSLCCGTVGKGKRSGVGGVTASSPPVMLDGTLAQRASRLCLKDHTKRAPIGTRITPPKTASTAPSWTHEDPDGSEWRISLKGIDDGSNVRRSKRDIDPYTTDGLFSALASDAGLPPREPTPEDPWASYGKPEPVTPRYEQLPTPPPTPPPPPGWTPEPRPASPKPWSSSRPTMPSSAGATPEDFGLASRGSRIITEDQFDRLGVDGSKNKDVSPFLPGWTLMWKKLGYHYMITTVSDN